MKTLTGLDQKITPIVDETEKVNLDQMQTFRWCFKVALGQGQSKTADESRRAVRAIAKLRQEGDVELSDEEFKTLMDRVAFNQYQFVTGIHGQLLEKLDECNK